MVSIGTQCYPRHGTRSRWGDLGSHPATRLPSGGSGAYLTAILSAGSLQELFFSTSWHAAAHMRWLKAHDDGVGQCEGHASVLSLVFQGSYKSKLAGRYGDWVVPCDVWSALFVPYSHRHFTALSESLICDGV